LAQRPRGGGPHGGDENDRDRGGHERERRREHEREEREPYDDPEEHHRIEKYRFAGGLPATPERYALAREQWYHLPGAVISPSMDPAVGTPALDKPQSGPEQ
jgi:hypothetical protein